MPVNGENVDAVVQSVDRDGNVVLMVNDKPTNTTVDELANTIAQSQAPKPQEQDTNGNAQTDNATSDIPTVKSANGKNLPQYHKVPKEVTLANLRSRGFENEDIDTFAQSQIKRADKAVKDAQKAATSKIDTDIW